MFLYKIIDSPAQVTAVAKTIFDLPRITFDLAANVPFVS